MSEDVTKLDGAELHRRIEVGRKVAEVGPFRTSHGRTMVRHDGFMVGHEEMNLLALGLIASIEWNRRMSEQYLDLCNPTFPKPGNEGK